MSEKQYFRNVEEGDVSFEGRQSNGFLAKSDGSSILYGAVKQEQLESLKNENFQGNVDVNGFTSSVIALIPAAKNVEFPEGNNNKETVQPTTDPNKVTKVDKNKKGYKTIITPSATITIPNNANESIDVFVFYPGVAVGGQIGKKYMPPKILKAVPDFYEKYVIVIPNEDTTKWENVKKEYEGELSKLNLTTKTFNIGIYSGSGNNNRSIQSYLGNLDIVNFIIMDPWPGQTLVSNIKKLKNKGTKVYMMYNAGNWGSYPSYPPLIKTLATTVGTNAISVPSAHRDIPTETLVKFRTEIEANINNVKPSTTTTTPQPSPTDLTNVINTTAQTPTTPQTPNQTEELPKAAPTEDEATSEEDFTFLSETGVELDPVKIFDDEFADGSEDFTTAELEDLKKIQQNEKNDLLKNISETKKAIEEDEKNKKTNKNKSPSTKSARTTDLGLQALIPNTSYISDSRVDRVINPVVNGVKTVYTRNDGKTEVELAAISTAGGIKPVDVKIVKAVLAMLDAATADNINLYITSGYRPAWITVDTKTTSGKAVFGSSQISLWNSGKKSCKCARPKGVAPAGSSRHGDAIAIDTNSGTHYPVASYKSAMNPKVYKWLNANAYKFGFIRGCFEEWHFEYWPGKYQYSYVSPFDKTYYTPGNKGKEELQFLYRPLLT